MKTTSLLVLATLAAPVAAQNTRPSVLVDAPPVGTSIAPGIATQGNLSVITYLDGGNNEYYAVTSDAAGLAWSAPVRIDRDTTASAKFVGYQESNPTVYVSRQHVYATWRDDRNAAFDDVYFNRSIDGGATFELVDQRLSTVSPPGTSFVRDWSMALTRDPGGDPNLDRIYVLMSIEVTAGGPEDLFLVASMDGGATFGPPVGVSTFNGTGTDVDDLTVCADGLNVYCSWVDDRSGTDEQLVRVSNDGGLTFGPEVLVSPFPGVGNTGGTTALACDSSGLVVVAFEDLTPGQGTLFTSRSLDFGVTWTPAAPVGNYAIGVDDVDNGALTLSGPHVVVAWEDNRSGGDEIYVATSLDQGLTWLPEVQVSTGTAGFPRFDGAGTELVVAWTGGGNPEDSLAAYSLDNGLTFTTLATPVSDTTGDSDFTELAYNGGLQNALVCWLSDDTGGNRVYAGGFALCPAGVASRNAGANPNVYVANPPILGGAFTATVDASVTGHALTGVVGFFSPFTFTLAGGQVLLVNPADPGGELLGLPVTPGPVATYSTPVANDPALCGLTVYSQAVLVGGVMPFALTNAQDITAGAL